MRILITGHKGFIGSAIWNRLKDKHLLFGIDKQEGNDLLEYVFKDNYDLIIHLAGLSGVRESTNDPGAYWFNNVEASRKLFDRFKDTRILYASSSSVYEPHLNPYAASKYIIEELAASHRNNLGLRLHTVWSENSRKGMFVDRLLTGKLKYITPHYRDFIHIEDVCDAVELLLDKDYLKGYLDIGTGDPIKVSELAPELPICLNTPAERQFTCANIEKLSNLGFKPKYFIKKILTNQKNDTNIIKINGDI